MKLNEIAQNDRQLDEILPVLAAVPAVAGAVVRGGAMLAARGAAAVGRGVAKGAQALGGALTGTPATSTGGAALAQAVKSYPAAQAPGAIDIVNALKDPKIAMQMKAMKDKMPGGDLDALVDPKGAADQQKQIKDLSTALDTLKKNAGIR